MNKLLPYIVLFAMIIAFVFSAYTLIGYLLIVFVIALANSYSDVRNKVITVSGLSIRYMLAKLFFWNRMVSKRVSFYFDVTNIGEVSNCNLGGIKFGNDSVILQYNDMDRGYSVNAMSDFNGVIQKGDCFILKDTKISIHFSYQYANTMNGLKWFITYWAMNSSGEKMLHGKLMTHIKKWEIILPDIPDNKLIVEIHA